MSFDPAEISKTWQTFRQPGEVLEMRIPKAGRYKTISGYYSDQARLIDSVISLDDDKFPGIYFTINPVNPDLLARAANRYEKYAQNTTTDADIIALHWLPIDIDAIRPAGISSTDEEHVAAISKAIEIKEWLIARGWPANCFVRADSGNGGHLIARIALSPSDKELVERCLKALDKEFSDDKSKVDVSTFNPARIWKLYGTIAGKGDNMPERPHRMACILERPETIETVPREMIEALAAMYGQEKPETKRATGQFDVVKYAEAHGATVGKISTKQTRTGTWTAYELDQCPFNPAHNRGEAIISVHENGARAFKCQHEGCKDKDWHSLRALWEGAPEQERAKTEEDPSGLEIIEQIKNDPRSLKDPRILNSLADLRCNDPIEFDLLIEAIKKANVGIKVATIIDLVDKHVQEKAKAIRQAAPKTPEDVQGKALAIAERGDSLKFLIWQAQRNHLGDIDYQKVLIASIASAASQTSNGIQPGGNGDKGSGKSDACAATYHLVPLDRRLDGSLSPMSLFYLQETGRLKPGMVLFSDDVEYEPIIPIYKRATARFQHGITHFTVSGGKTREAMELIIPPRMVWWLTSVESVANEQAFDRQYPISTDSSPDHKKRVAREIAARRARKELRLEEDEGIEVARAIIADIFDNGPFKVLIPQSEKAEWLKVSDFRGQEQFWDLVDALVILRWRRHQRDVDGWLIAEDRDLIEAKAILSGHKVAHFADLTEAEEKVVGVMSSGLSMTQKDLTEALGVAQSTLSARLASIMAKSAIITEDVFQGKKIYTLNPKMDLGSTYWAGIDLVKLNINTDEAYRSQQIALSGCYRYLIGVPIGIIINNSNRIPSSLSINLKGSIERDTSSCEKCLGWAGDVPSSILSSGKTTDNDQKQQQEPLSETDNAPDNQTDKTDNAISEPIDIPIRQAEGDLTPEQIALLERIKGRFVEQHAEVTPYKLAVCMRSNDQDIGIARCKAWLEAGA